MNRTIYSKPQALWHRFLVAALFVTMLGTIPNRAADVWTDISSPLLERLNKTDTKTAWPGGCSGVVVNRLNGDVITKAVGCGLWRSSDLGASWNRIDSNTISGRDETGWATSVDQNAPQRIVSFSLDGSAGWTSDGVHWSRFSDNGRNWDYGSVDWASDAPKTIIVAKHETTPPGEVDVTTDGGLTWKKLPIYLNENRAQISMVGVIDATTLVYGKGEGIYRSTDVGATWTKVSSANPQTRIPIQFKGIHYLGNRAGLLVTRDKGASWQQLGAPIDIWQGPFFGSNEMQMVIAGNEGIFKTTDAGRTWARMADLKPKERGFLFSPNWFGSYAWDPVNDVLYASAMGNPVYRIELGKTAGSQAK